MADNPFSEPGDLDRTVIRPMPGGTRAAPRPLPGAARSALPQPAAPFAAPYAAPCATPPAGPDIDAVLAGDGPLAIAAAPLLHLLARLRNAATAPDPGDMRQRTRRALRAFERRALDAGVPPDQVRLAHYALCAALDDAVLNTPWGSQGRWRDVPLAQELHEDASAGRGFFDQVRTLRDALPAARPVLEIMFTCLSLGMMGPYRTAPDGAAQLERIRHHVYEMIEQAAPPLPAALTQDAGGVHIPLPPRGGVPVWVAGSAALALVATAYVGALTHLNAESDAVYRAALAAPPAAMPALVRPAATPPPPPPPPPGLDARLRAALSDLAGIELVATPTAVTLRLPAATLFPQPNATLAPGPLLDRVVLAIGPVPGPIRVLAYTDSQPSRGVGFPSNFALSAARAQAVRAALARTVPDPARIAADGRADADPIAPNTTPQNRERNRRIEIVLTPLP